MCPYISPMLMISLSLSSQVTFLSHCHPRAPLLTLGQGLANISSISRNCASLSPESWVQCTADSSDLYTGPGSSVCHQDTQSSHFHYYTSIITQCTCQCTCDQLTQCPAPLLLGGVDPLDHPGALLGHVSLLCSLSSPSLQSLAPAAHHAHRRHWYRCWRLRALSLTLTLRTQGSPGIMRRMVTKCVCSAYQTDSDSRHSSHRPQKVSKCRGQPVCSRRSDY